jgi:hypothetical protein
MAARADVARPARGDREVGAPRPRGGASYWSLARSHRYSLTFALPLLLLYEALAALRAGDMIAGVRNGADVLLKQLVMLVAGEWGPMLVGVGLVGGSIWLIARDLKRTRSRLRPAVFAGMALECVVLALLFGGSVALVTANLLDALALQIPSQTPVKALDPLTEFTISLGAGLYEELVFRVLLTAGLAWAVRAISGVGVLTAGIVSTLVSALIFSAFHYVGPYGDPLELPSFAFRAVAGVFFSAMYLARGFGITAWTHALYDVFLLFAG